MKASDLFAGYRDRSTAKLWEDANFGRYRNVPPTPKGKEVYRWAVGASVTASGKGGLKAGTQFTITDRGKTHGFVHYYGAGMWHRQQDIAGPA